MKLLNDYNKAKHELFKHLGISDSWGYLAIEDSTEYHWCLFENSHVDFTTEDEAKEQPDPFYWDYYQDEIHPGAVFRTAAYVGIICFQNRHDMYLRIFDPEKESFTKDK